MIDYLDRAVDSETGAAMRAHLINCEGCRKEVDQLRELLATITDQEMRQPGHGLRENFQVMLQSELNMETADDLLRRPREGKEEKAAGAGARIGWMSAAACVLLVGGMWIGSMLGSRKAANVPSNVAGTLGAMQNEIREMKEAMLFSLIDNEFGQSTDQGRELCGRDVESGSACHPGAGKHAEPRQKCECPAGCVVFAGFVCG